MGEKYPNRVNASYYPGVQKVSLKRRNASQIMSRFQVVLRDISLPL